jgi:hypothetical protein
MNRTARIEIALCIIITVALVLAAMFPGWPGGGS